MTLYHGSTRENIKALNAVSKDHHSTDNRVAYLTSSRTYALFYIRDIEVDYVTCGVNKSGIIVYDEHFPNQLECLYRGVKGYVYHFNSDSHFEETAKRTVWVTRNPVHVMAVEKIDNVYEALLMEAQKGHIKINHYEGWTSEKKKDIHEMMVYSLFKKDFKSLSLKSASFFKKNFEEAYAFVESNPHLKVDFIRNWEEKNLSKNF